jgi:hypothetical protein
MLVGRPSPAASGGGRGGLPYLNICKYIWDILLKSKPKSET